MRTTVDLPPRTHQRVKALASARGQSISAILAELTAAGLREYDLPEASTLRFDPLTGFPSISTGRPVTSAEVAELIDEDS